MSLYTTSEELMFGNIGNSNGIIFAPIVNNTVISFSNSEELMFGNILSSPNIFIPILNNTITTYSSSEELMFGTIESSIMINIQKTFSFINNIIVRETESIFDILLRYYGDISNSIELMLNNKNIANINQRMYGLSLFITPLNQNTYVYYYNKFNSILRTSFDMLIITPTIKVRVHDNSFVLSFD